MGSRTSAWSAVCVVVAAAGTADHAAAEGSSADAPPESQAHKYGVALEKLARRGYGIVRAFHRMNTASDWKRPKDVPKSRRSRIDYET